jgi:hypothetical protein
VVGSDQQDDMGGGRGEDTTWAAPPLRPASRAYPVLIPLIRYPIQHTQGGHCPALPYLLAISGDSHVYAFGPRFR